MEKIKIPKKTLIHPAPIVSLTTKRCLENIKDIKELALPLKKFGFEYFTYSKMVNNIRYLTLSNHPEYLKHYFDAIPYYPVNEFIEYAVAARGFMHPRHLFSSQQIMQKLDRKGKTLQLQWDCGMHHSISIPLFDDASGTVEIFSFYATTTDPACVYQQFSQVNNLANFILYFKEKGKNLLKSLSLTSAEITNFSKNKIILPKNLTTEKIFNAKSFDFNIKNYELGSPFIIALSRREFECLKMAYIGMTAKQIGRALGASYRTVEKHLEKVRAKANNLEFNKIRQALFNNYLFQLLLGE